MVALHDVVQHGIGCCLISYPFVPMLNRYLFANARATRIKLLVYDGIGIWPPAACIKATSSGQQTL